MANKGNLGAIFLGIFIGYFVWGNEPAYIDNAKSNEKNSFVLQSTGVMIKGRYQVAVIHGFIGNEEVCNELAENFEIELGYAHHCIPALSVTNEKPWWNIW